jgi:RNA polymerase sigma-70 factor, ECF subfamily
LPGEQRFDEFYAAVFGRLVGQLYLVTGDLHDAEDVVQEALTRAAARWSRLREYEVPEAWVRRVAVNLATDGFRHTRRRLALAVRLRPAPEPDPPALDGLAAIQALRALPRDQRAVVVLHHLLDLPVDRVAAELGVPVGTVKSRLARARGALAARLGPATRAGGPHAQEGAGNHG